MTSRIHGSLKPGHHARSCWNIGLGRPEWQLVRLWGPFRFGFPLDRIGLAAAPDPLVDSGKDDVARTVRRDRDRHFELPSIELPCAADLTVRTRVGRFGRGERTARTRFEEDVLPAWRYGSESADHLVQPRSDAAEGIMVEAEEAGSEIACETSASELIT
jgi:hypothetical protein